MSKKIKWAEVWIDSASRGEYVLILRLVDNYLEVVDPQNQGKVVKTFDDYENAVHWLNEDEYDMIEGRWMVEL